MNLIGFAFFHSFFLRPKVRNGLYKSFPKLSPFGRFIYNTISIMWLGLLALPWPELHQVTFAWPAPWIWIVPSLSLLGLILVAWVIWTLDLSVFLGLKRQPNSNRLVQDGLFRLCRHPLYLGLILIFVGLPVHTIFSLNLGAFTLLYCFIGSFFEEARLLEMFGESYADFQKSVPRIMPWPRW